MEGFIKAVRKHLQRAVVAPAEERLFVYPHPGHLPNLCALGERQNFTGLSGSAKAGQKIVQIW